ncbi:hypothetical protein A5621_26935 [Mycobacterium colombiense]|uniref:DUF3515 domain-containing protein n=1 Tax=Mycobacterium colombiense TaxID=339268 RepID=UPI0007ED4425|nr:DUF3515 domain-containing protein [Mycobacterium colombiense]OBJ19528.1 hypothetical protein A9W93_17520 [Mycobacterium colombiense]OBJ27080.1 hypothetical protein A5621_26935 [Mycobacterium colombiense]OBJ39127.1 hypothetical protein A5620_16770 [Mycobacterium colombiense]OBJ69635.1 hypothetical protein A5627_24965 [Mycobacterium colombiense]OBK62171.1 hypothetical protein A5653_26765 [Mycobacterium colombiense]
MAAESDADAGPPRALIIAAIALAVVTIGVILAIAATREAPPRSVAVPEVPAPQADGSACRALMGALPQRLGNYQRAPLEQPAPQGAAAWRSGPDSDPVVLRCGLDRPAEFVLGSPIQVVDRVQWFQVRAEQQSAGDAGRSTWYAVDRGTYVALTLPTGSGPTPIQRLSEAIDHSIPAAPIDPGQPR